MTNSTVRRNLSVGQRLWTLGGAAFIGFGSMLGIGWYENMQVDIGLSRASEIQQSIDSINDMRVAGLTLVLAAMDTIVDKDEKTVQPERMKIVADSLATLSNGSKELSALAGELKAGDLLKSYDADVAALRQAIQIDLKALVEQGASDAEFDKIDDFIDGAGDKLTATLASCTSCGTSTKAPRCGGISITPARPMAALVGQTAPESHTLCLSRSQPESKFSTADRSRLIPATCSWIATDLSVRSCCRGLGRASSGN